MRTRYVSAVTTWVIVAVATPQAALGQDIVLTGIVRDFQPNSFAQGHPDFEQSDPTMPDKKYIAFCVEPVLGDDGKPVFNAGGWKKVSAGSQIMIDVEFFDLFRGWAVGVNGTILHTADAGKTWAAQDSGTTNNIVAIDVVTEVKAWAVTDRAEILATADGGETWVDQTPWPWFTQDLTDIHFPVDDQVGYAVGRRGVFARTTDGGATWQPMVIRPNGSGGWETVSAVPQPAPMGRWLLGVNFIDNLRGCAVGLNGTLIKTFDGGNTWSVPTMPAIGLTFLTDVEFTAGNRGYAVGNSGMILQTINAGNTWTQQVSGTAAQLNAVTFPERWTNGWAVGAGGLVLSTTDGGVTWVAGSAGPGDDLFAVDFPTDHYGYTVGDKGVMERYDPPPTITRSVWQDDSTGPATETFISETMFRAGTPDIPVVLGNSGVGTINSASTFAQWYTDTLNVNLSAPLSIRLVRQGDGSLLFSSSTQQPYLSRGGFFPIEGLLLGNPGMVPDRNFHFTLELHARFDYDAGTNQTILTRSDDDLWIFINDKLVIATAGVHWGMYQKVDLSRLGLTDGEPYQLDLFYAERQAFEGILEFGVNFELRPGGGTPGIFAVFD